MSSVQRRSKFSLVERRIGRVPVLFDPCVIWKLKSTQVSGHKLPHNKKHVTRESDLGGRVLTEGLEGREPLLGVDVEYILDMILGAVEVDLPAQDDSEDGVLVLGPE